MSPELAGPSFLGLSGQLACTTFLLWRLSGLSLTKLGMERGDECLRLCLLPGFLWVRTTHSIPPPCCILCALWRPLLPSLYPGERQAGLLPWG